MYPLQTILLSAIWSTDGRFPSSLSNFRSVRKFFRRETNRNRWKPSPVVMTMDEPPRFKLCAAKSAGSSLIAFSPDLLNSTNISRIQRPNDSLISQPAGRPGTYWRHLLSGLTFQNLHTKKQPFPWWKTHWDVHVSYESNTFSQIRLQNSPAAMICSYDLWT